MDSSISTDQIKSTLGSILYATRDVPIANASISS